MMSNERRPLPVPRTDSDTYLHAIATELRELNQALVNWNSALAAQGGAALAEMGGEVELKEPRPAKTTPKSDSKKPAGKGSSQ